MGSANGGEWQPKKEEDKRFLGEPGEIKESQSRSGVPQLTKIGKNGKAEVERHLSDHHNSNSHTNPHDHPIDWSGGFPHLGKPINYPNGAPEFKSFKEIVNMEKERIVAFDDLAFESLGDIKWCLSCGSEIEFIWKNKCYTITHPDGKMCIGEAYYLKDGKAYNILSDTEYDTNQMVESEDIDDILNYKLGQDRLRDNVTKIGVVYRSL